MRGLLNVLWFVFGGGFLIGLEYLLGGVLLCLTIVGVPFGMQCLKIARLGMFPFGRDFVAGPATATSEGLSLAMNIVWIVVAGLWIFLSHVALAISLAVTLIGIPFAIQHLKLALLALAPFGKQVVEIP